MEKKNNTGLKITAVILGVLIVLMVVLIASTALRNVHTVGFSSASADASGEAYSETTSEEISNTYEGFTVKEGTASSDAAGVTSEENGAQSMPDGQ